MGYTKKDNPRHSLDAPLTPIDREVALLKATTVLKHNAIALKLQVHYTTVQESLYKPNVRRYIKELEEKRERMLLEHSIALLIAEQQEEYRIRLERSDARRERDRLRKAAQHAQASKNIAGWHAAGRPKRQHDNENG